MAKLPRNVIKNSVRIPSAADLKQRFLPGSIPTAADFANLIDMANAATYAFTPGMIVMFNGSASELPDGWAFCDGSTAGVPDLSARFVVGRAADGSSASAAPPLTGSGANLQLSMQTADTQVAVEIEVNETRLDAESLPAHSHGNGVRFLHSFSNSFTHIEDTFAYEFEEAPGPAVALVPSGYLGSSQNDLEGVMALTESVGAPTPASHSHGATMQVQAHSHSMIIKPPYYALAFIMKLPYP